MSTESLLPKHLDPFRFSEREVHLTGTLPLSGMSRLCQQAGLSQNGSVKVDLQFNLSSHQKIPLLRGHVEATLALECQRCAGPFVYEIMADFLLGVIKTLAQEQDLPHDYEIVLMENKYLVLSELIEDELILNMPMIPKHELGAC